ncbi:hypothetical protein [Azotobacter beijerinckii]|uniref:hypothetical protein n=1 Tax=Azotobacter beijerinckii TaxID=170623 RepID=UPI00111386B0|nr:hypothetical protein [Azotobacter beijerinckii]
MWGSLRVGTLSIAGSPDRLQVHSQLMLVGRIGHSQLIPVENRLDCRSGHFRLQVVTATGSLQYDWSQKIRLQLTRAEMPVVTAVLLGMFARLRVQESRPGQGQRLFAGAPGRRPGVRQGVRQGTRRKRRPDHSGRSFFVSALFVRQLRKACPWMDASSLVEFQTVQGG